MAEALLDQLLSEHFGPEVAAEGPQQKLYAYLAAYKSAGWPWGAPWGLTFTGCSLSYCHISLCFYSKSSSPVKEEDAFLLIGDGAWGGGGLSYLHEYKSDPDLAGFEVFMPGFCMLHSGSVYGAGRPLTVSLGGVWPEAELTCLFTACFMYFFTTPLYAGGSHVLGEVLQCYWFSFIHRFDTKKHSIR